MTRRTFTLIVIVSFFLTMVAYAPLSQSLAIFDEIPIGGGGGGGGGGGAANNKCCNVVVTYHQPQGACQQNPAQGGNCNVSNTCDGTTDQPGHATAVNKCLALPTANCKLSDKVQTPCIVDMGTLACPNPVVVAVVCDCKFTKTGTAAATVETCLSAGNTPCPLNEPIPAPAL